MIQSKILLCIGCGAKTQKEKNGLDQVRHAIIFKAILLFLAVGVFTELLKSSRHPYGGMIDLFFDTIKYSTPPCPLE
jgi:hypothetical protein